MSLDPITAIAIAGKIAATAKELYLYYQAWDRCEEDIRQIRKQLLWLCNMFLAVHDVLDRPILSSQQREQVESALHNCRESASELVEILDKIIWDTPIPIQQRGNYALLAENLCIPSGSLLSKRFLSSSSYGKNLCISP
jgi:hypothetical protein